MIYRSGYCVFNELRISSEDFLFVDVSFSNSNRDTHFPELIDNVVSRLKFGPSFFGTFVQMAAMSNHFIDVNRVHDFLQSYLRLSDLFFKYR